MTSSFLAPHHRTSLGQPSHRPRRHHGGDREHGDELALVIWPGGQYYTGQVFDLAAIAAAAHAVGARVGFDLAHAAGNIELSLHDWGADFAAWCTYKYLNGGPGSIAGAFVHERHFDDPSVPRLLGWWGTEPETRFEASATFASAPGADGWQVSCGAGATRT